jgi:hypothetical protein
MTIARTSLVLTAALVTALAATACKKDPEYPVAPMPSGSAPMPPPTASAPLPPPPPSSPQPCDAVQSAAFASIFSGRAPTEAMNMELEGAPVCGVVGEGMAVSGPTFFLQPGMCYAVLANGMPNVAEVDVQFVLDATSVGLPPAAASMMAAPLAVDMDTGSAAAIGTKNNCYKWPFPIPASVKVLVKSRTGAGPVAAQVYRKKG